VSFLAVDAIGLKRLTSPRPDSLGYLGERSVSLLFLLNFMSSASVALLGAILIVSFSSSSSVSKDSF